MTLPVRTLILYKHGICIVERRGTLQGKSLDLTFRREQMNDVLKSLVAVDLGGGTIQSIAYDAPEEREARLARGSIHLSHGATMVDLLRDLRGRRARVQVRPRRRKETTQIEGIVVGLDLPDRYPYARGRLSMLTAERVQVLPLREVVGVEPLDAQAGEDLAYFLAASVTEPDQRTVTLHLSEGAHDLSLRYLVPSPTWRVSYRLVGSPDEASNEALLQGWGIFDNPFDETLEGVAVELVSGMPISFVYDLYTPFTPDRPVVQEEARVAPAPVEMEAAAARPMLMRAHALHAKQERAAPMSAADTFSADAMAGSTPVQAESDEGGEHFAYRITEPVSVQRGEAAMVPVLAATLPYRREHVYNARKLPRHPMLVLRFDNASGLTLERGPVTVVENGRYTGEAILPFSRAGAEVLLPVAVDLGVRISENRRHRQETHGISIRDRYLLFETSTTEFTTYEIRNDNAEPMSLLIEHPRRANFEPFQMEAPEEETAEHRRWRVAVPAGPGGQAALRIVERRPEQRREELSGLNAGALQHYLQNRWLDQALAGALGELLALFGRRQQIARRVGEIEQEENRLRQQQEQARKNMSGLRDEGEEGEVRARFVRQLNHDADLLAALAAERDALREQAATVERQIETHIAALGTDD